MKSIKRTIILFIVMISLLSIASASSGTWTLTDLGWQYLEANGNQVFGWQRINKKWYWFDNQGIMVTGLQEINGSNYFFSDSGSMLTGWQQVNDQWLYFSPDGSMLTNGWVNNEYYMGPDGLMLTNTITPDGYYVDASGRWIDFGKTNKSFEKEIVRLVNEARAEQGLHPLNENPNLTLAAEIRAGEIQQVYDHIRPDGSSCFTIFSQLGIQDASSIGENIAMYHKTPQAVFNDWMNSAGHYENIMDSTFRSIGVGVTKYKGRYYWTQLFSSNP